VECAARPLLVSGVEDRLAQAVVNLVDNALSFARRLVLVRLAVHQGQAVISVADDGPGVSPGNRDKIFTRFFSVRPAGRDQGAGLGLAIVAAIARAHAGRVELGEEGEGALGGACFHLRLPLD
jgi:signal transduction histidine kinase